MLPFDYARPATLGEAHDLLSEHGDGAKILAGGTDLIVGLRHGAVRPALVVDLKRVTDLPRTVELGPDGLIVGAVATLVQMIEANGVREHFPALVEAADTVGSVQIRNRATLAGNICNASPAADTMTPLLVYGASVRLSGPRGERVVPVEDFVTGPRRIARERDELVSAVTIPLPTGAVGASFARMTRRRGVDLATINLSCLVDEDGITTFAFGAVGPRPFRVVDDSGILADRRASIAQKDEVIASLVSSASPITDVRASKEYRLAMLTVTAKRILGTALDRLDTVRN